MGFDRKKAGGDPASHEAPTASVGMTALADTEYVDIPVYVPADMTLKVWLWSARTTAQTTPSGLTLSLYDYGAGQTVLSERAAFHAEDGGFVELAGETDASLRLNNNTGGQLTAGGVFGFTIS